MISVSNEFREILQSGYSGKGSYIDIQLEDSTILTINQAEIIMGGLRKETTVSEDNTFTALGSAIINSFSCIIDNRTEQYSTYNFKNAKVTWYIMLQTSSSSIENKQFGTYTVDEVRYNGATITLECLDNMEQFDRPYETSLLYPNSLYQIVREACNKCGVTLKTTSFPRNSVRVPKPTGDAITFRDVIASVAQIAGCFATCNSLGQLELKWFDKSYLDTLHTQIDNNTFDPNNLNLNKAHYLSALYSQDIAINDVVITGVEIDLQSETDTEVTKYVTGSADYLITIQDNLFINESNVDDILNYLGSNLIGLRFRSCSISHLSYLPIEAGDIAVIKDRKGSYYPILITRTNCTIGSPQATVCGAETPSRNISTIYSKLTKTYVNTGKLLNSEKTTRELQYQELARQISSANGLYMSTEDTGSGTIYYLHNKRRLEDSDIVWKMTADAFAVSTDGGETWNAGMTVDGNLIANILSARGINADWINAGSFTVYNSDDRLIFEADKDTGRVYINGDTVLIGDTPLPNQLVTISNNAKNYTDGQISIYNQLIDLLQTEIDGKTETWYQDTDPSIAWNDVQIVEWVDHDNNPILDHNGEPISLVYNVSKAKHNGDYWHRTTDNTDWIYQDGNWRETGVPADIYDEIDGKAVIFTGFSTPTDAKEGDLWFKSANNPILTYVNNEWIEYNNYTDDSALSSFLTDTYGPDMDNINGLIDGKIDTFYQATDPSISWTAEEKSKHTGDIWYNSSTQSEDDDRQKTFRYDGTQWVEMTATPPAEVFDVLDGKAQIFSTQPTPPYYKNDLWLNGSIILVCVSNSDGQYKQSDWAKKETYTDDTNWSNWVSNTYASDIASIQTQVDGKIETYSQSQPDPSDAWTTSDLKSKHTGDIWYNPTAKEVKRWSGTGWIVLSNSVAEQAASLASSKATIYTSTPYTPYNAGDLWITSLTDTQAEIKICVRTRTSSGSTSPIHVDGDWISPAYVNDSDLTSEDVFNRLTNNGTLQVFYRDATTGKIYINAEYIRSGYMSGERILAGTISADRIMSAEGVNLYSSYDTMAQIALDSLTNSTSPNAIAGITSASAGPGYNLYSGAAVPVYGASKYFRLFAPSSSGDTNVYIFLGHSSTQDGLIPVEASGKYRISFYARGGTSNVTLKLWQRDFNQAKVQTYQGTLKTFSLTTSWTRYEANYTANPHTYNGTEYATRYLRLGFALTTANTYLDVCAIMVEKITDFGYATSPFSPASVTVIEGGSIRSKSITSDQIKIVGGWTIEANRMYANGISLTANNGQIDFQNYTNPYGNQERTTAFITNDGIGSFYYLYSDDLTVGGELLSSGSNIHYPSFTADRNSAAFYQDVDFRSANRVLIHTQAPFEGMLRLSSYAAGAQYYLYVDADGNVVRGTTPVSSSKRYKNHVRELTEEEGNLVYELNPVWYKYKDEYLPEDSEIRGQELAGFYAEDILQTMPNVVYFNKEGQVENWKERELIPYLVKTIQTQHKKIKELEKKIDVIMRMLRGDDDASVE